MNISFENQLDIIENENLLSCKANYPVMTPSEERLAVILDSQDLHILCKLAKSNNMEVILYAEKMVHKNIYHIYKENLRDEYEKILPMIESVIDEYNMQSQQLDFDKPVGVVFYFVAYGKYYIQEMKYTDCQVSEFPTGAKRLEEILAEWEPEIERIRLEEEQKREELLEEFLEFVRKDPQFILLPRRDYARSVFIANDELGKYKTLFYSEDDVRCENSAGANKCYQELEKLHQQIEQERRAYKKTEEYAKRMSEFEEFVRKDDSFWQFDFPGHRRDYSYQVFLTNPLAEKYRTLFYAESDVECKEYDARRDCFYQLERIYNEGKDKKVKIPKFFR